ncbi:MAG: NnrU family protein [Candidatus Competibacteraceae bacterium]|nr:NnrU family protein [Candidatus Competibacteraceae bacterium]MCP5127711.1 NnrU family protein [Gammaproteobacteria bacterium]HRX70862.1 NnrU family protein [Candidatus Competibacteraceae bacterium]
MSVLILGLVLFLAVHSISIVNEPWRDRLAASIGERLWQGLYSLASLIGFSFIVWGYGLARQEPMPLYLPPAWLRHIALLLMVPVFPLLLAVYLPGCIQAKVKHPMLAATKLWAFAHLLANGMLADVLLFGSFLAWAVVYRISIKRRVAHPVLGAPPSRWNDWIAVIGGLALYVAFVLWLHLWLIGVAPVTIKH